MADKQSWMIYGATGYTGALIAEATTAAATRPRPILAGRSATQIERLGRRLQCATRVFTLDDPATVARQLDDVAVVLHCAGPFSQTAAPMMEACLRAGCHYLDITGEIDVIEQAAALDARAKQANVVLMPAVGFDVVPSDCLARATAEACPGATSLLLAFTGTAGVSRGTIKTLLESIPCGPRARRNGRLVAVPRNERQITAHFPSGPRQVVAVPWGDVASAYYTTDIGNITTYVSLAPDEARQMSVLRAIAPLLRLKPVLRWLQRQVDRRPAGPTAAELTASRAEFWCEVRNPQGKIVHGTLTTPGGYALTVLTAVAVVDEALAGRISAGFQTPAGALGWRFIEPLVKSQVIIS